MIDVQLINDALATIAVACGAAIFLAISVMVAAAVMRRRTMTRSIHAAVERLTTLTDSSRGPALH